MIQVAAVAITAGGIIQRLSNMEQRFNERMELMREQRREDLEHIDSELKRLERNAAGESERMRQSVGAVRGLVEKLLTEQGRHGKGD